MKSETTPTDFDQVCAAILTLATVTYTLARPGMSLSTAENVVLERWRDIQAATNTPTPT